MTNDDTPPFPLHLATQELVAAHGHINSAETALDIILTAPPELYGELATACEALKRALRTLSEVYRGEV